MIVRARSDRAWRCKDKDQSKETEDQALISAITFLSKTFHNYNLMKPETCFSCESLALQDYNLIMTWQ